MGASTRVEASAPSSGAGTLALQEPRRQAICRRVVLNQARRTLDELEEQLAEEELALAEERTRLGEAWALLHERVELCRRQDAAAQAERQEALRFAKETRDSVKREAVSTSSASRAASSWSMTSCASHLTLSRVSLAKRRASWRSAWAAAS